MKSLQTHPREIAITILALLLHCLSARCEVTRDSVAESPSVEIVRQTQNNGEQKVIASETPINTDSSYINPLSVCVQAPVALRMLSYGTPFLGASIAATFCADHRALANRQAVFPTLRYHMDDYLQYAPLTMRLIGATLHLPGTSLSLKETSVVYACTYAYVALIVLSSKKLIGRLRPDESSYNSLPSGHCAVAFAGAELLSILYGEKYPAWVATGYTLAEIVTWSRVLNNRHLLSDTFAGSAVGILSAKLGSFIARRFFRNTASCGELRRVSPEEMPWVWGITRAQSLTSYSPYPQGSLLQSGVALTLLRRFSTTKERITWATGQEIGAGMQRLVQVENTLDNRRLYDIGFFGEVSLATTSLLDVGMALKTGLRGSFSEAMKSAEYLLVAQLFTELYLNRLRSCRMFVGYNPIERSLAWHSVAFFHRID